MLVIKKSEVNDVSYCLTERMTSDKYFLINPSAPYVYLYEFYIGICVCTFSYLYISVFTSFPLFFSLAISLPLYPSPSLSLYLSSSSAIFVYISWRFFLSLHIFPILPPHLLKLIFSFPVSLRSGHVRIYRIFYLNINDNNILTRIKYFIQFLY